MLQYSYYSLNAQAGLTGKTGYEVDNLLGDYTEIIIAPLMYDHDAEDHSLKSGHLVGYLSHLFPFSTRLGITVKRISTKHALPSLLKDGKKFIILVDDFIGSGDTAKNSIAHCKSVMRSDDKLVVLTLVGMEHALQELQSIGVQVVCGEQVKKGIKENDDISNKNIAYSVMDAIEGNLEIDPMFLRGYDQSEALVTLLRTPDNTFPIYWCRKAKNSKVWPAPFPRASK